jgi:cell division septation protein DedD
MTQTDGEKELVLGNKQLLSLFFVVVALCGVCFALGYIIGRNSRPAVASLEATPAAVPPAVVRPQEPEPPRETAAAPEPPIADGAAPADAETTATETQPARDTPAPPVTIPASASAPVSTAAAIAETGSTWLQVTALRRVDADNLVKTLREQRFPALLADSSKPDLFRVVVGPYHDMAQLAEAKAKLKALGFANAFVQK